MRYHAKMCIVNDFFDIELLSKEGVSSVSKVSAMSKSAG